MKKEYLLQVNVKKESLWILKFILVLNLTAQKQQWKIQTKPYLYSRFTLLWSRNSINLNDHNTKSTLIKPYGSELWILQHFQTCIIPAAPCLWFNCLGAVHYTSWSLIDIRVVMPYNFVRRLNIHQYLEEKILH